MDYAWLEPRHDPIVTDTNLAEIDFENFKNEDLAYAFSCGEEESGGSSTDMSICRSEPLFSSILDSEMRSEAPIKGAVGGLMAPQDSLIQDSLTDVDFNFGEKVIVNKNNYTLTYSGQGVISSFIASMVNSTGVLPEELDHNEEKKKILESSGGKMTTWSTLSKSPSTSSTTQNFQQLPPHPVIWQSRKELNNNGEGENGPRKTKSMPDFDLQDTGPNLVNAFIRGRTNDEIPMMRSKDTVNHFLKTNCRLTSIEERAEGGFSSAASKPPRPPPKPPGWRKKSFNDSSGASSATTPSVKFAYPDLDFLENDVGLWDTFFARKNTKFQSVLRPPLPMEEYLVRKQRPKLELIEEPAVVVTKPPPIFDTASLRALLPPAQKHLVPIELDEPNDLQNEADKPMFSSNPDQQVKLVKVKQAWAASPEAVEVVLRRKKTSQDRNLNLLNNNGSGSSEMELNLKRRSYHPQDYLSQVLDPTMASAKPQRKRDFPKSGSQNDLVDSWRDTEEDSTATSGAVAAANNRWATTSNTPKNLSAEYPFHNNLCMPAQGINFDLTHKRGLFVNLYSAVERLLMYQDDSSSNTSVKYVLFHELCPALMDIMKDGLKAEVITSFGRMKTSVWRVVEAVIRQGPNFGGGAATSDLVMLLNAKFPGSGEDHRKFSGFVAGLLNMSSLHVWFTKLKWSMEVLLRFYERHAFICALHKETKLLFDELVFCLQRLYSVAIHVDLPFTNEILDDIPASGTMTMTPSSNATSDGGQTLASSCSSRSIHGCLGQRHTYDSNHGEDSHCCSNCVCCDNSEGKVQLRRPSSASSSAKSRIPRPISLPKRLESKLSPSRSPARPPSKVRASPTAGPVRATSGDRKSRVRDTVKLFDSKMRGPPTNTALRKNSRPKTGAGEAMASNEADRRH